MLLGYLAQLELNRLFFLLCSIARLHIALADCHELVMHCLDLSLDVGAHEVSVMDEVNPALAYQHIFPANVVDVVPDVPTSSRVPIPEAILRSPREADEVLQSLGSMGFFDVANDDEDHVMSLSHLHTPYTSLAHVLWCAFEQTIHIFAVVIYVVARRL